MADRTEPGNAADSPLNKPPARSLPTLTAGRWARRLRPGSGPGIRLFCFPYAGGGASMFRDWPVRLPPSVDPYAVQLPGREGRLAEPAYDRMAPLVDALADGLAPLLAGPEPYAFAGISMGAKVALELTRVLRDRGRPLPRLLGVASCTAPSLNAPLPWTEPDEKIVDYMRSMGATPAEVLIDEDLLDLLVPTMRADLTLLSVHEYPADDPVDVPIHAFAGLDDPESSPERMRPWAVETRAGFRLDALPGDHLLSPEGERRMLDLIAADLTT
ncbi:thioesterase II family protein [Rhizomonospora bruguierae]|uniref:thioesterase II family protein n=1 Tax=Rhizomonospora bruguierae TaxID=1581705 RepID=UPI001BCF3FE8|nr:thioesterase domain-containing protein [Micromonospora sp. NBRC 107566]